MDFAVKTGMENFSSAEIGILLDVAFRQLNFLDSIAAYYITGIAQLEFDAVAIQVMPGCNGEAGTQRLPIDGGYHQLKGLVRWQHCIVVTVDKRVEATLEAADGICSGNGRDAKGKHGQPYCQAFKKLVQVGIPRGEVCWMTQSI